MRQFREWKRRRGWRLSTNTSQLTPRVDRALDLVSGFGLVIRRANKNHVCLPYFTTPPRPNWAARLTAPLASLAAGLTTLNRANDVLKDAKKHRWIPVRLAIEEAQLPNLSAWRIIRPPPPLSFHGT